MSQEQMLKCEICTFQYDSKDRRPCVLVPCGHTLCKNCLDKIDNQKCPNDRQRIEKYVVNWELIKLVSANEASKQIREKLIVLAHRIEELSKLRAKTTNKLDNEIKQIEASTLKLKKNSKRAHEYFEVKLTSLVKRVHGERDEITREEKRMRDVLESIDNDFRSTQLEQPRLVEMTFQLEREIGSIDELYNRIEEHYRVNQKTTDLLLTKLSSRTYLERLESVKSAESMDRIELERFRGDGDDDDDDDNSSLANLGLLELFETFETKEKIYVILLMTVVLPIILSYPIAMIVIAVLFRNKCLVSPQLPLWLLIYGIFGLIVSILSITLIEYLYITRKMRKSYIILSILLTLLILSSTFQVSWFFYGNYLVFSTFSQVNFEETRKPNHNYCNSTLYIFTFQAVIVPYILVFMALIVSIGVYFRKVASNQLAPPIEQVVI